MAKNHLKTEAKYTNNHNTEKDANNEIFKATWEKLLIIQVTAKQSFVKVSCLKFKWLAHQ